MKIKNLDFTSILNLQKCLDVIEDAHPKSHSIVYYY